MSIWFWIAQNNSAWPEFLGNFQLLPALLLILKTFVLIPHNKRFEAFLEQYFAISGVNSTDYHWGSQG